MRKIRPLLSFLLLGLAPISSMATQPPVVEIPGVTGTGGLLSGDFSTLAPYVIIDDYATKGDGGGGYFTLVSSGSYCNSSTNFGDGGVTLNDGKSP